MQTFLSSTLALKKSAASSKLSAKRFSSTSLFRNSMQTSVSATSALISQLSTCFWWIVSLLKLSMLKSSGLKPIPMRLLVLTNSTTYCRSGLSIKLICPMRTSHRSISIGLRNLTSSRKRPTAFFEGINLWLLSRWQPIAQYAFFSKFSLSKTV